jgi:hypothetical protein
MYKLSKIVPLDNYVLDCYFSDGVQKKVDLKPILDSEAFTPLKSGQNFQKAVNKSYFVEWLGLDIDLSADTLWHWGQ